MILFFALLQLLFLIYYTYTGNKKQGIAFWVDPSKIFVLLWITTLCLYNFRLSSYYNPTLQINLIVMAIGIVVFLISRFTSISEEEVIELHDDLKDMGQYNKYFIISNIISIAAILVFVLNAFKFGLAILGDNKINKQPMTHYSGYIVYMLTFCAQIKYIMYRTFKKRSDLVLLILSVTTLFLTLNRGPLAFLFTTVYIYEVINFTKGKKAMSKKNFYMTLGFMALGALVFLQLFAYMGNIRMQAVLENKLHITLQKHYGMYKYTPAAFVWIYMYITSPLENVAFSLANQSVQYTYFSNLFYPFVKFISNIFGQGADFKVWLTSRANFTPYLWHKIGLNASSFMTEGYQDLGVIGVLVYIAIYCGLIYWCIKLLKKKINFSSIGVLMIYSNVLNILLWSVFVNSLKITILIMNVLLVLAVEMDNRYGFSAKIIESARKKLNK